ncbi:MAG: class I SAM-dependent methyltransferase [Candidatus Hydrogenedentes bacterium]|nr:class I SAM-dependent methyltransferase [Candidatus Hydrogenedentota bacterium]
MLKDLYFRHLMKRQAGRLAGCGEAAGLGLSRAMRSAAAGAFSAEEHEWIGRIEPIRREMEASSAEVRQPDWGATSCGGVEPGAITRIVGEVCRSASKPKLWAGFLLKLVREFRPGSCLELGTCLGVSACYEGAGLHMNGAGRLVTLEGAPEFAEIARANFQRLGLSNVSVITGPFQKTLGEALDQLGPIDYAFIDGHHQEAPTIEYFRKISARANPGAVLVFDDINWSDGMKRAWRSVASSPGVFYPVNLHTLGVCIYGNP